MVGAAGGGALTRASPPRAQAAAGPDAAQWPHEIRVGGASVTVYPPQVIAWPDRARLTARAAVGIIPAGQSKPFLGTSLAHAVNSPYPVIKAGDRYYVVWQGAWFVAPAPTGPLGSRNPATGRYSRGSAAWGPYRGTANASTYDPRTGVASTTHQNENAYGRWGSSVISGPGQTVHTESGSNARGSAGAYRSTTGGGGGRAWRERQ